MRQEAAAVEFEPVPIPSFHGVVDDVVKVVGVSSDADEFANAIERHVLGAGRASANRAGSTAMSSRSSVRPIR